MPCRTGILSFRARAATTGFCSVDRISIVSPLLRRAAIPRPSPRCTETNSRPSESISTLSSVWVPSKSRTTALMSSRGRKRTGSVRVEEGGQRAGAGEVVRVVDLQHAGRVGADELHAAEEAVLVLAQARRQRPWRRPRRSPGGPGAGPGGGAGRTSWLTPLPPSVDSSAASRQMKPWKSATVSAVSAPFSTTAPATPSMSSRVMNGLVHWTSRTTSTADPCSASVGVQGVQDGGLGGGGVTGDGGGAQYDLGARLAGGGGDRLVVGGDHDVRDEPRRPALAHRAGHQRHSADREEVLGGDALEPPRAGITASAPGAPAPRDPLPSWSCAVLLDEGHGEGLGSAEGPSDRRWSQLPHPPDHGAPTRCTPWR